MASRGKTKVIDKGYNALRNKIAQMAASPGGAHVKVGFIADGAGSEDHGDGLTVTQVAVFNEFGTSTAPERAALRTTADEIKPSMATLADRMLDKIVQGKSTVKQALEIMGLKAQAAIREAINNWTTPPNAPSTIRQKGANNPLVDTGQMRNSVEFESVCASPKSVRPSVVSDS